MESQKELLIKQVDERRQDYNTESYPMSIGELASLYQAEEIKINPTFQRYFRWTPNQKTKLIESILLGIPIPSIFIYQNKAGIWELVDGLQRVSSILQFMGVLKEYNPLVLSGTKVLPSLEGMKWESKNEDTELPSALKLKIKRSKLNLSIILDDSGKDAKYEVFQRLNTSGSFASNQEIRNVIMLMAHKDIFDWFMELAANEDFLDCISLSKRLRSERYEVELVLRFLALMNYEYLPGKDLKDYLDDSLDNIINDKDFDYTSFKLLFEKIFKLLNKALGKDSFKLYKKDKFAGKFLESAYEAISIGLGNNIDSFDIENHIDSIKNLIIGMWSEEDFTKLFGSGTNTAYRIPKIIPYSIEYFKNGQ